MALDLNYMFYLIYSKPIKSIEVESLKQKIAEIESETGFLPYVSHVEEALSHTLLLKKDDSHRFPQDLPEKRLEEFAQEVINSKGLPQDRFGNVLNDLLAFQKFYRICNNPDIELLQDLRHTFSLESYYRYPCKYIIKNKKSGIQTSPSENIDKLIEMYGEKNLRK